MERTVKYSRRGEEWQCADLEEALSVFLYEMPTVTIYNVFPPRHILNIFLLRGSAGGSVGSPRFTWEPFEISEYEYQTTLPKLLDPDWSVLYKKLWRIRLPMKLDPEFDEIVDRDVWMSEVCHKHTKSLEVATIKIEQFRLNHAELLENWSNHQQSLWKNNQARYRRSWWTFVRTLLTR